MSSQRFLRCHRLRTAAEFQRVYERRASSSDNLLLVFAAENALEHPRLGLSVSRKVGNAVARNRWKRLIREAFRLSREQLPAGFDLVVIPRPAAEPALQPLIQSLVKQSHRAARRQRR